MTYPGGPDLAAPLTLRPPEALDLVAERFGRARATLDALGYDVADLEHLEPGDVALPLDLLDELVRAATIADDVYPRRRGEG